MACKRRPRQKGSLTQYLFAITNPIPRWLTQWGHLVLEESKLAECTSHSTPRKHFCKAMSKANALELRQGSAGSGADSQPLFYMGTVIPALCSTLKVPRQYLAKLFCTQARVLRAALCEEINEQVKARHWAFLILYLCWWVSITKRIVMLFG